MSFVDKYEKKSDFHVKCLVSGKKLNRGGTPEPHLYGIFYVVLRLHLYAMRTGDARARLRACAGSPELTLVAYTLNAKLPCASPPLFVFIKSLLWVCFFFFFFFFFFFWGGGGGGRLSLNPYYTSFWFRENETFLFSHMVNYNFY